MTALEKLIKIKGKVWIRKALKAKKIVWIPEKSIIVIADKKEYKTIDVFVRNNTFYFEFIKDGQVIETWELFTYDGAEL